MLPVAVTVFCKWLLPFLSPASALSVCREARVWGTSLPEWELLLNEAMDTGEDLGICEVEPTSRKSSSFSVTLGEQEPGIQL